MNVTTASNGAPCLRGLHSAGLGAIATRELQPGVEGTFSFVNAGAYGVRSIVPIVRQGQATALGLGRWFSTSLHLAPHMVLSICFVKHGSAFFILFSKVPNESGMVRSKKELPLEICNCMFKVSYFARKYEVSYHCFLTTISSIKLLKNLPNLNTFDPQS